MIAMASDDVDLNNQAASNSSNNNSNRNNDDEEDDKFAGEYFFNVILKSNTATGYTTIKATSKQEDVSTTCRNAVKHYCT
jgi:hypothetical protein